MSTSFRRPAVLAATLALVIPPTASLLPGASALPAQTGPVASYAFENDLTDSAGDNDGTSLGNGYVAGRCGRAASFTSGSSATIPAQSLGDFSVAGWFRLTSTPGTWSRYWDFGTPVTQQGGWFLSPQNGRLQRPGVGVHRASGDLAGDVAASPSAVGTWHHLTVTFDEAGSTTRVYTNGSLTGTGTFLADSFDDFPADQAWLLGDSHYPGDPSYEGLMDDLQVFDRVLDPAEVQALADPLACTDGSTAATTIYGITGENRLVSFSSTAPSKLTKLNIRGLASGERLLGIDFRPADDRLYAISSTGRIFTVDLATARLTPLSTSSVLPSGSAFGVDFNPVADRLRVVSDTGQNLRINVDTGVALADTPLDRTGVSSAGYTNSVDGATGTTLYDLDTTSDVLVIQNPPNAGTTTVVGSLGVDASNVSGFDITSSAVSNRAFAALTVMNRSGLYDLDLTTGATRFRGFFGGVGSVVRDIAVPVAP